MCGRYTLVHSHKEILKRFRITKAHLESKIRFNIAPSQKIPIVIYDSAVQSEASPDPMQTIDGDFESGSSEESRRFLELAQWGLVPTWARGDSKMRPMINARAETAAEKPSFRSAFKKRRCLIPADGFYEWKNEKGKKIPVRITLKDTPLFAFAGLYEDSKDSEGAKVRTCTILTVEANSKIAPVHERMPVILKPESEDIWLRTDAEDKERLMSCLVPCPEELIDIYEVSTVVNSARIDTPECIEPAPKQLNLLGD